MAPTRGFSLRSHHGQMAGLRGWRAGTAPPSEGNLGGGSPRLLHSRPQAVTSGRRPHSSTVRWQQRRLGSLPPACPCAMCPVGLARGAWL